MADEARDYLLFILRDGNRVDRHHFAEIFGVDIPELFGRSLEAWKSNDIARLEDDALVLVPQERRARANTLLWLMPEVYLEREIAKRQGDHRR